MYESRNFIIFSVEEINKINFNSVLETSPDTLRKSADGTKTFVKWDQAPFDSSPYTFINAETGEEQTIIPQEPTPPSFLNDLQTKEGPYTYEEILEILNGPEWTAPIEEA